MSATRERSSRRKLFDPVVGQHHPKLVRNGTIFCIFAAIFLYVIYTKPSIPFLSGGGRTVTADFAYASNVVPGRTPVDEYGVTVGVVSGVKMLAPGKGVQVTMSIMPGSGVHLHSDATAALRWRTLLGLNFYIDLLPGSPSAPALGNAVIPENRTSSQVELDQALQPLNSSGRHALGTMIDQFNEGFADPSAVRSSINAAAPAMGDLAQGLPGLRGTNPGHDLPQAIATTDKWMGALAADDANLGNLINNGANVLSVTAANRVSLGGIFDQAPNALLQTQATMARLRQTIDVLDPIARQLEPGASDLAAAARQARVAVTAAQPLLTSLKPTLAAIRPSVSDLGHAARTGIPVVTQLSPVLARVKSDYLPWLSSTNSDTKLKEYEAVGPTLASVSSALGYGDQYGTLAGFEAGAGENAVESGENPCSTYLTNPDVPLQDKVDCQAITQLLTSIYTGRSPLSKLSGGSVSENLVDHLLKTGKL